MSLIGGLAVGVLLLLIPAAVPRRVARAGRGRRAREGGRRPFSTANCSVVFFHHVEKSGGTTLRTVMQRYAQHGIFDVMSFVNRQNKLQLQMILHRLHTLSRTDGGLQGLRLAVEIHVGGHLDKPYFFHSTLRDLILTRATLRRAGCRCNLVTLLRAPLQQARGSLHSDCACMPPPSPATLFALRRLLDAFSAAVAPAGVVSSSRAALDLPRRNLTLTLTSAPLLVLALCGRWPRTALPLAAGE